MCSCAIHLEVRYKALVLVGEIMAVLGSNQLSGSPGAIVLLHTLGLDYLTRLL